MPPATEGGGGAGQDDSPDQAEESVPWILRAAAERRGWTRAHPQSTPATGADPATTGVPSPWTPPPELAPPESPAPDYHGRLHREAAEPPDETRRRRRQEARRRPAFIAAVVLAAVVVCTLAAFAATLDEDLIHAGSFVTGVTWLLALVAFLGCEKLARRRNSDGLHRLAIGLGALAAVGFVAYLVFTLACPIAGGTDCPALGE